MAYLVYLDDPSADVRFRSFTVDDANVKKIMRADDQLVPITDVTAKRTEWINRHRIIRIAPAE